MTARTPGPWTIRRDSPDPANPRSVVRNLVCVEGSGPVAEICAPAGKDWPGRCDANAALIAAAPEMAAAAKACLERNGGPIDAEDTDDGQAYVMVRRVDFDALDAAWRKATGAEPPRVRD